MAKLSDIMAHCLKTAPVNWERIPSMWNAVTKTHRALAKRGLIEITTVRDEGNRHTWNLWRKSPTGGEG